MPMKRFLTYLKVVVAAVGPELQSAAAVESAASPVVGTKTEICKDSCQTYLIAFYVVDSVHVIPSNVL